MYRIEKFPDAPLTVQFQLSFHSIPVVCSRSLSYYTHRMEFNNRIITIVSDFVEVNVTSINWLIHFFKLLLSIIA